MPFAISRCFGALTPAAEGAATGCIRSTFCDFFFDDHFKVWKRSPPAVNHGLILIQPDVLCPVVVNEVLGVVLTCHFVLSFPKNIGESPADNSFVPFRMLGP